MSHRSRSARTPRATFRLSAPAANVGGVFPRKMATKAPAEDALDIADIRARLMRLRDYAHVPVRNLPDSLRQDHEILISYAEVTYHMPQEYEKFYSVVSDVFSSDLVATRSLNPGTIGAFYVGCRDVKSDDEVCSFTCAGSLPRPGFERCDRTVLRAVVVPPSPGSSPSAARRISEPVLNYEVYSRSQSDPTRALLYVPSGAFTGIPSKVANLFREQFLIQKVRVVPYAEGESVEDITARAIGSDGGYVDLDTLVLPSHSGVGSPLGSPAGLRPPPSSPGYKAPEKKSSPLTSPMTLSDKVGDKSERQYHHDGGSESLVDGNDHTSVSQKSHAMSGAHQHPSASPSPSPDHHHHHHKHHAHHAHHGHDQDSAKGASMPWWAIVVLVLAAVATAIALTALIVAILRRPRVVDTSSASWAMPVSSYPSYATSTKRSSGRW